MPRVEARHHLIHEVGRVHVHAVERDRDLEGLLAVAHVGGAAHRDLAREGPQPLPPLRLQLRIALTEPRRADITSLAHMRSHHLVAEVGREHAPGREDRGHPRDDHPA